jgi:2-methylcitrate dehydratase PrpD
MLDGVNGASKRDLLIALGATGLSTLVGSSGYAFAAGNDGGPPSLAEHIGKTVSEARSARLSDETRERVRLCLIDTLGTLAFTSRAAKNDPYLGRIAQRRGIADALILGTRVAAPVEDVAGALAFLIHYSETDDSDFRAEIRASPCVIGPALALAQRPGVAGEDLMAAIAAGYSVQGGLAEPFGPLQDNGLMSAGVWGPAASAAVAARMLRLDPSQTANAISLAMGAAGGAFQYFYDQTEEKRLILARAARAGVESALLAQRGEHGARLIFEGRAGVFAWLRELTNEAPDLSQIANVIARLDGPTFIYPKFFAASSSIIPTLEALMPLVAQGLRAGDVERFSFRGDPAIRGPVRAKLEKFEAPQTSIGAKTNYAYMVAYYLTHGKADAGTIAKSRFDDPSVLALAAQTRFEDQKGLDSYIVLYMKSGETRVVQTADQVPSKPAPQAQALRDMKFRDLVEPIHGKAGAAELKRLASSLVDRNPSASIVAQIQKLLLK